MVLNRKWTKKHIPNQRGKVFIITGANSGLGFDSARILATKEAEIVLACRSLDNAKQAIKEIKQDVEVGSAQLHAMELDLQNLASIEKFAKAYKRKFKKLDVLMNNAGVMNTPYGFTDDGFETQMGTNHLGHFALTGHLLPVLKKTPDSRVVTVSSTGHKVGKMDFSDLLFEDSASYSPMKAYARSKLANLLFAYQLQKFFRNNDYDTISVAAHPGASQTNLGRHIEDLPAVKVLEPVLRRVVQSSEMGALPQLRAATDPKVKGGDYYGPGGAFEMSGYPKKVKSNRRSKSSNDAKRLWQKSEGLTQVVYE